MHASLCVVCLVFIVCCLCSFVCMNRPEFFLYLSGCGHVSKLSRVHILSTQLCACAFECKNQTESRDAASPDSGTCSPGDRTQSPVLSTTASIQQFIQFFTLILRLCTCVSQNLVLWFYLPSEPGSGQFEMTPTPLATVTVGMDDLIPCAAEVF